MWLLVLLFLVPTPGHQSMQVLAQGLTQEECRTERNRVGFEMAASYPYDRDFVIECHLAKEAV
jgi:hypothetical protein